MSPITSVNGFIPITSAPPEDVAPTIEGYGMSLGVTESIQSGQPVPPELLDEGLVEFLVTFEFEEYVWELQGGQMVKVSLSGQTIDWSASQIAQSGELTVQFGVSTHYDLAGKVYSAHQYTFLDFSCLLMEGDQPKGASWTARMKHF